MVLVGNRISPGNPVTKSDGTVIRTLWGELAWQLGGKKAYKRIQKDDERATSPGDALRELMQKYGPCLILIDEWVAYARQLHEEADLPAGSFETHFSFAQALTESAKLAKNCLLVISLPTSEMGDSKHAQADNVEVGGEWGRAALDMLRNAVGRLEASWRPASAEEGFEIVRRRLFEPLVEKEQFVARDNVARAYYNLYHSQKQEFPAECADSVYEKRIKAAYPIHPEVFDRLYSDWSTLVKFQRTRGVLRLMATVIHCLWEKGDRNPLIMPANIPIDDPQVENELTRFLSDNWVPIIEKDVDGPNALPLRIDGEAPNLGKYKACLRVARTIYMGSAPIQKSANQGLEDRRIKLGCVMPGEPPSVFGDALRRLSGAATYLYMDGSRYWYSTQPTVTKVAEDRAEQLMRDPDKVAQEIERRVRADVKKTGDFCLIHPFPHSGADAPDNYDAKLVVLGIEHPFNKENGNPAIAAALAIFENRGNTPRLYRNTMVFLAVDKQRLQDLDEAVRRYLAWESILDEKETLDLSPHQVKQAEEQRKSVDGAVVARIPEAYQWLLVPEQNTPQEAINWNAYRLSGQERLAVRASKKLLDKSLMTLKLASTSLRMEMDRIPLWRGEHVEIKQLVEDFSRYLYLQRLKSADVLLFAIRDGFDLMTWEKETFAYAESFDEETGRYRGLRAGEAVSIDRSYVGLLVKPEMASKQLEKEKKPVVIPDDETSDNDTPPPDETDPIIVKPKQPKRYHGTVSLDSARVGRDAGKIAEEVIAHLNGLVGASVRVTLEIEADIPDGVSENVVRIVTENGRTLKFTNNEFEVE